MDDEENVDYLEAHVFRILRSRADAAERALRESVEAHCLRPHNPTQHRDGKPPWCEACGRTARGVLIMDEKASE